MDKNHLEYAVSHYKTPLYVYDIDILEEQAKNFINLLNERTGLCFAMKANPFLTEVMSRWTDRIEVCSMGEFYICQKLCMEPEKLLISGVLKKEKDLLEILGTYGGRCSYTAESLHQFDILAKWSEKHKTVVTVYLRLTNGTQFGMDEADILKIIGRQNRQPYIKIAGIHYFTGTQKKSVKKIYDELEYLDGFLLNIENQFHTVIEELEYGPGIPAAYFEGQEDKTKEFLKETSSAVCKMKWTGRVTLEMGRAFCASCGYYVTRIEDIKQCGGKNYCIVDGGIHQLHYDGQIRGMYLPKMYCLSEEEHPEKIQWTVCGSLCTFNDVLAGAFLWGNLSVGDALVFEGTGAYSSMEGMSLFLSHELPKAVFYRKSQGWKLVRDEMQTYPWNMVRSK